MAQKERAAAQIGKPGNFPQRAGGSNENTDSPNSTDTSIQHPRAARNGRTNSAATKNPEIPRNLEAETAVQACVLIEPTNAGSLVALLRMKDFSLSQHQVIWEGVCALVRQGDTPDILSLFDWLNKHDRLEAAGGAEFISHLPNLVPHAEGALQWAQIVLEYSARRARLDHGLAEVVVSQRPDDAAAIAEVERQQQRLDDIQRRLHGEGCAEPEHMPLGISMSEVAPEEIHWLWHQRVALGKMTVADGDPGLGKSLATIDLATRVAMGNVMPDGSPGLGAPAGVILICGEDGLADTVKPRLLAAGASPDALERIRAVNLVPEPHSDGTISERLLSLLADLPALEATITAMGARLLVIDPITAYLGSGTDMYKDADLRRVLTPLALMAERAGVAVILVRHLNKSTSTPALHRGLGGVGFIGVARLGLLFAPNPDVEGEILVSRHKGNIGAPPPTLAYRIEQVDEAENMPRISWLGERETSAGAALAMQSSSSLDEETRSATDEAVEWLRAYLADGPHPAKETKAAAHADDITDKVLRSARLRICKKSEKAGMRDGWKWELAPVKVPSSQAEGIFGEEERTAPVFNGTPTKMPTLWNGGHLRLLDPTKMPSEDETGHLRTNPESNGREAPSNGHISPKMPSAGDIGQDRASSQNTCPRCGGDDLRRYGGELRCYACDVLIVEAEGGAE